MASCCICSDVLTIDSVVNTKCEHQFCKICFWKWMKNKNTCPLCRTNILYNDDEINEQRHMQELLEQRSSIVRQVEETYEQQERLDNELQIQTERCRVLSEKEKKLKKKLNSEKYPYQLLKYQQLEISKRLEKKRKETKTNKKQLMGELKYILYKYVPRMSIFKIKMTEYKKILKRKKKREKRYEEIDFSNSLREMFNETPFVYGNIVHQNIIDVDAFHEPIPLLPNSPSHYDENIMIPTDEALDSIINYINFSLGTDTFENNTNWQSTNYNYILTHNDTYTNRYGNIIR